VSELEAVILELWSLEGREFQYFGQEMAMKYVHTAPKNFISTYEFMPSISTGVQAKHRCGLSFQYHRKIKNNR